MIERNPAKEDLKSKLLDWCAFYTKTWEETTGVDLSKAEIIEDDWDTRFLWLATHCFIQLKIPEIKGEESSKGAMKDRLILLYSYLVSNTHSILKSFGLNEQEVLSFVPNFHIRQYDYLVQALAAQNQYEDQDQDQDLFNSWYGTTAEDLIDQNKIIEIEPESQKDYIRRARAKWLSDDYQGAILDYDQVIENDPSNPNYYIYRGHCKDAIDEYEAAIEDFTKALEIDPKNIDAYKYRAFDKSTEDDKEGAIADLTKALEIDPDDWDLYNRRATARLWEDPENEDSLEDISASINDYLKAIDINPQKGATLGLSNAYQKRAELYLRQKLFKEAIEDYDLIVDINTSNRKARTKRGIAKKELGDKKGACMDWQEVLDIKKGKYESEEDREKEIQEAIKLLKEHCE